MARMKRVYGIGKPLRDVFPVPILAGRAPVAGDTGYEIGQVWVRTSTDQAWMLTSVASAAATWSLIGPGASDVDTLTGDSGGTISPAGGNVTLAGGTNVTSVGAGSTVTFNLDAAIVLATSVSAPLYTAAAGIDLDVTAPAGQDIVIKMGDAAAANKVSFTDTADAEVASIDSNGAFTTTGLTFTGLLTANASATILTAGTALNLGSDNSADAVNLGVGTTARAIGIGNSAAAHTITVGSVTGAASLDLLVGTGDFTLEGNVASTYGISATGVNTGTITIGGGTGAQTLNMMNSTAVKTVNLANGVSGNTVSILNGINTSAQVLNLASGANAANSTVNVLGGIATAGTQTLNLATGASASAINIGNVTGATAVALNVGTGNFALEGNVASTYDISGTGVNTGTVTIAAGTGARTVNIATGGTGIKTVNIATGASADIVTIGTVTGAASLDLKCGTGNLTLEGNVASTYEISSTGVNTGTCKFASGTGARTVEIAGGGTGIKTINIGAAATADVITIGTTTGAGSLTLAAGSGDITMSGTIKEIDAEFLFSSGTDLTITQSPILQSNANTGVAPTGATGDINLMYLQDGSLMEQFILGAGQTIIAPRMSANGLNIALDLVDNEGAEYNFGARAGAKHAYTIGTSAAFFLEAQIYVADLSGCEPLWLGFRKVQANDADYTLYTDFYTIGLNNATSATAVSLGSQVNTGGVTLQSSTDAWGGDGSIQTLRVLVSAAGVVTATISGAAPSAPLAFTFDNADVVMPFIHFLHDTTTPGEISLLSFKCGFQA